MVLGTAVNRLLPSDAPLPALALQHPPFPAYRREQNSAAEWPEQMDVRAQMPEERGSLTSRRRTDLRSVCGRLTTNRRRRKVRIPLSNRAYTHPRTRHVHILTAACIVCWCRPLPLPPPPPLHPSPPSSLSPLPAQHWPPPPSPPPSPSPSPPLPWPHRRSRHRRRLAATAVAATAVAATTVTATPPSPSSPSPPSPPPPAPPSLPLPLPSLPLTHHRPRHSRRSRQCRRRPQRRHHRHHHHCHCRHHRRRRRRLHQLHRRPPSHRPASPPHDPCNGVDVFDYFVKERVVCARSRCMRTFTAERQPNAPLITPSPPRLALQCSTDHLLRALWLCLPVRSFRHLHRLARRWRRGARHIHLGTVQRH